MLEPWIIDEIMRKEREKREEQRRRQPTLDIEEPSRQPEADETEKPSHEMPSDRKPGHEMPNPNEPTRPSEKKKEDEQKRGVDISRITGNDDEADEDSSSITVNIKDVPLPLPDDRPRKETPVAPPDKKPE